MIDLRLEMFHVVSAICEDQNHSELSSVRLAPRRDVIRAQRRAKAAVGPGDTDTGRRLMPLEGR